MIKQELLYYVYLVLLRKEKIKRWVNRNVSYANKCIPHSDNCECLDCDPWNKCVNQWVQIA